MNLQKPLVSGSSRTHGENDLAQAVWEPSEDGEGQPFTLTVLEEGESLSQLPLRRYSVADAPPVSQLTLRPIQRVPCAPGSNLRKTLLANGFQERFIVKVSGDSRWNVQRPLVRYTKTCVLSLTATRNNYVAPVSWT